MKIGPYTVEISHADKVFFPDEGITKGDLVDYYRDMGETMLPYMSGRPISMQRFPDGIRGEGFYQKEMPDYFPDWIESASVQVQEEGSKQPQVVVENVATLVYLANQGCITPHIWLSRVDKIDNPDRLIFDLDPPSDNFEPVRSGAFSIRKLLEELGLTSFVMTTGSRGLHVVVPLDRSGDFDHVRAFASDVAEVLASREPDALTNETRKDKRKGRLFLDYLRNSYAQTSVTPYAVRAKPGAPVAAPLDWDELSDKSLVSKTYNTRNISRRLGQKDDPWKGMARHARSLDSARKKLAGLKSQD